MKHRILPICDNYLAVFARYRFRAVYCSLNSDFHPTSERLKDRVFDLYLCKFGILNAKVGVKVHNLCNWIDNLDA